MDVLKHRPKAIELALVQAGYTLADIRGEREVHTVDHPPTGAEAVVGAVTPTAGTVMGVCVLALAGALAAETGLLSLVAAGGVLALALHLVGRVDVERTEVRHEVERPGMQHREVVERLTQWDEWQRIKNEKEKKQAQKAQKQAKAGN